MSHGSQEKMMQEETDLSTTADELAAPAWLANDEKAGVYRVNFGQEKHGRKQPLGVLGLIGRGQVTIDSTGIVLSGSRSRFTFSKKTEQVRIPLSKVVNAGRTGLQLSFYVEGESNNPLQLVQFKMASLAQANQLLQRMPVRQTEAFAKHQVMLQEYHARLLELSPRAPITPVLITINVMVFAAMCIGGVGFFSPDGSDTIRWGSNFGPMTMGGQWWRLFTSLFIHFGIIHLALNMFVLLSSGAVIERLFGSVRFLLLYLCAGLSGSMASLLWNPVVNSAGASGAIFGIFGGLLAFVANPRNGVPAAIMNEQRNNVLFFAMYNLAFGFAHSGIDNAAHVGGLVGGFLSGLLLARPLRKESRSSFGVGQLALGLIGSAVLLALMSWPLVRPSEQVHARQQFQLALLHFGPQERQVNSEVNGAWKKANSNELSPQGYASLLMRDAVPVWERLHEEVSAPKLAPNDSQFALQQLLKRYTEGRLRTVRLIAQGILNNDNALMEQAQAARADADEALEQLNKLNKGKS
jgi:rhomboid protease GluP